MLRLLVDLILSRDGWARIGPLAGSMADIDTEVENRSSNEVAFVQVKSKADQGVLNEYIERVPGPTRSLRPHDLRCSQATGNFNRSNRSAGASVAPRPTPVSLGRYVFTRPRPVPVIRAP